MEGHRASPGPAEVTGWETAHSSKCWDDQETLDMREYLSWSVCFCSLVTDSGVYVVPQARGMELTAGDECVITHLETA